MAEYRDFNLGDWIGHISGVIEDETELDGNEMRDLLSFLTKDVIEREKIDKAIEEIKENSIADYEYHGCGTDELIIDTETVLNILKKHIGA